MGVRQTGAVSGRTAPDLVEQFAVISANGLTVDGAVRLGRERRDAARPRPGDKPPFSRLTCTGRLRPA